MCILTGGEYDFCSSKRDGVPAGKDAWGPLYTHMNAPRQWEVGALAITFAPPPQLKDVFFI